MEKDEEKEYWKDLFIWVYKHLGYQRPTQECTQILSHRPISLIQNSLLDGGT